MKPEPRLEGEIKPICVVLETEVRNENAWPDFHKGNQRTLGEEVVPEDRRDSPPKAVLGLERDIECPLRQQFEVAPVPGISSQGVADANAPAGCHVDVLDFLEVLRGGLSDRKEQKSLNGGPISGRDADLLGAEFEQVSRRCRTRLLLPGRRLRARLRRRYRSWKHRHHNHRKQYRLSRRAPLPALTPTPIRA